jgi:hypothetical protein
LRNYKIDTDNDFKGMCFLWLVTDQWFWINQQNFWHIGFQLFFRWIWIDRQTKVGSKLFTQVIKGSSFIDGNNGESQVFDYKIKTETRDLKIVSNLSWMTLNPI